MSAQPKTCKELAQRTSHLFHQEWMAIVARHEDIRAIANGGPQDDSQFIRKVFAHINLELHLKKHEAETSR